MAHYNLFLLYLCSVIFFGYGNSENKRILVNDQDFTQQQIHSLQTTLQDLKSKLATQNLKLTMQEAKITSLENKLLQQEDNVTAQQNKVLLQESKITGIIKNLSDVMIHNFLDEMAQALCSANLEKPSYAYALRRDIKGGHAKVCNDICTAATSTIRQMIDPIYRNVHCFDAYYIQKVHPVLHANPGTFQTDSGIPFMSVFRYHKTPGCDTPGYANYCCCSVTP